jgi:hypothetical protein
MNRIAVGAWQGIEGGPMQVVSGPIDRERIQYQAPSSNLMDREMSRYIGWFETARRPVLRIYGS